MLITTRFGETAQVHLVRCRAATAPAHVLSRQGVQRHLPADQGRFLHLHDGHRRQRVPPALSVRPARAHHLLTDGRSQNGGVVWSSAGDRIAYGSTRRNGKDRDLYVQDPRQPQGDRRLAEVEGGGWQALDWSPDDTKILALEAISANEKYLWILDAATGAKTILTPKGGTEKVAYGRGEFAADGRSVYVTTDRDSEFQRLATVDLATGKHTYLTSHIDWDVDSFALSHDGKAVAFVTNEDGIAALRLMYAVPAVKGGGPAGLVQASSTIWPAHEQPRPAFPFASARSPPTRTRSHRHGKAEAVAESETAAWTPRPCGSRAVHGSRSRRTISGFLYRTPSASRAAAVIVNITAGGRAVPSGFVGRSNYYRTSWDGLLLPTCGGQPLRNDVPEARNGLQREDSVKDIGSLLDWIATRPDLDAAASWSRAQLRRLHDPGVAVHYADASYALSVVGIRASSPSGRRPSLPPGPRRVEYGDERPPGAGVLHSDAASHVDKITRRSSGARQNDPRPGQEGEQMVAAMKKNGRPVWWLVARDEGHGFVKRKNQDYLFYATVAFIQQHLLS